MAKQNGLTYEASVCAYTGKPDYIVRLNGNMYTIVSDEGVAKAMCAAKTLGEARAIEAKYLAIMPLVVFG